MKEETPIVDEVRRRASQLSARFDDDLQKYVEHLRDLQDRYADRVVDQLRVVRETRPAEELKA